MAVYRAIKGGPVIVAGFSREIAEGELLDDLNPGDIELLTAHGWIEEARGEKSKPESAEAKRKANETRVTGEDDADDDDQTLTTKSVQGKKG